MHSTRSEAVRCKRPRKGELKLKCRTDEHYRIGFEIGWDLAFHGLQLMPSHGAAIVDGHQAWCVNHPAGVGPSVVPSVWVRKWLLVRSNAWRRHITFSAEVTPEHLRAITPENCPITRRQLTKGTLEESDWSLERVNNDLGYVEGNVAIISAFANTAKGAKTPCELIDSATSAEAGDVLQVCEKLRLAALSNMAIPNDDVDVPFALHPPAGVEAFNLRYRARAVILTTGLTPHTRVVPNQWVNTKRRKKAWTSLTVSIRMNFEQCLAKRRPTNDCQARELLEDAVTQPATLHFLRAFEVDALDGNPAVIFTQDQRDVADLAWRAFARDGVR